MEINTRLTNDFILGSIDHRIVNLTDDEKCTADITKSRVAAWQAEGGFVVANAGAYDILGLNHLRGLMQARIIGAAYKLGSVEKPEEVYELASSDEIRLVVSVDTNGAIAENKSFKETSGASIRPILDWETRAKMLALQSFGGRHDLVDFVTKHGPNACPVCTDESCAHSSDVYSVASSGANLTVIKAHNQATFDRHPDSHFHVIDEMEGAFFDRILDSKISTTALVKRIRMQKEQ